MVVFLKKKKKIKAIAEVDIHVGSACMGRVDDPQNCLSLSFLPLSPRFSLLQFSLPVLGAALAQQSSQSLRLVSALRRPG